MAEVVIVGAMIGAGIGGVVSGRSGGSIWEGALMGGALGAAGGYGVGALGAGAGAATDVGAGVGLGVGGASSAVVAPSAVGAAVPAAVGGLTTADMLLGGLSLASTASSLMNQPNMPSTQASIPPEVKKVDPVTATMAEQTPFAVDEASKRNKARQLATAESRAAAEEKNVASLFAMQQAYTDPRSYLRTGGSALGRQTGQATSPDRFRFSSL